MEHVRRLLTALKRFKLSILAFSVLVPLCVRFFLFGPLPPEDRTDYWVTKSSQQQDWDRNLAVREARSEAIARITHLDALLVGIGSVQLGIMAYIGGLLFGKETEIRRKRLFFFLIAMLLSATSSAYLHVWNIGNSYAIYATRLEQELAHGLRPMCDVFQIANDPLVANNFRFPVVAAGATVSLIATYPVFLLIVALVSFGRRLDVSTDVVIALAACIVGMAVFYSAPGLTEFTGLSRMVHDMP